MLVPVAFVNPSCPAVTTPVAAMRKRELVAKVALVVATSKRLFVEAEGAMYREAKGALVVPMERPLVSARMVEVETILLFVVDVNGQAKSDEEETLLLNVVQSPAVRSPRTLAEEDGMFQVKVPAPLSVMPQSFEIAVEEVAKMMAPVCAEPKVCRAEVTPVTRHVPPIA